MKKYSVDTYIFNSPLSRIQIHEELNQRTLVKESLTMEWTEKDFIGRLNDEQFELFQASFLPYGAACIINGKISPTSEIQITTSLHGAFRIMFFTWAIAMTILIIVSSYLLREVPFDGIIKDILGLTIATLFFRLFLHLSYIMARNNGVKRIKEILKAL